MILDGTKFDMHAANIKPADVPKKEVNMLDFHINSEIVMKTVKGLFSFQKILLSDKKIKETIFKVKEWFDHFTGNEEEAAMGYLMTKITEAVMSASSNAGVSEVNVLMLRYAFHSAKNEAGENWFDLFDLLILTFLFAERDGFYQLEVDNEFWKRLMEIGEFEEDHMYEFIAEAKHRLEIRVHLASLILKEQKRVTELGRDFNICDDDIWKSCRFSRICMLMGEKCKDQNTKKAYLDVYAAGYENHITYSEFYQAFKNVLGINNVAEWMLEDFMSQLDMKDEA